MSVSLRLPRRVPAIVTYPEVGRSSAARMCMSVDLPEPEGPMIAVSSPLATSSETPLERVDGSVPFSVAPGQLMGDDDGLAALRLSLL